jgi:hypothetical protein
MTYLMAIMCVVNLLDKAYHWAALFFALTLINWAVQS